MVEAGGVQIHVMDDVSENRAEDTENNEQGTMEEKRLMLLQNQSGANDTKAAENPVGCDNQITVVGIGQFSAVPDAGARTEDLVDEPDTTDTTGRTKEPEECCISVEYIETASDETAEETAGSRENTEENRNPEPTASESKESGTEMTPAVTVRKRKNSSVASNTESMADDATSPVASQSVTSITSGDRPSSRQTAGGPDPGSTTRSTKTPPSEPGHPDTKETHSGIVISGTKIETLTITVEGISDKDEPQTSTNPVSFYVDDKPEPKPRDFEKIKARVHRRDVNKTRIRSPEAETSETRKTPENDKKQGTESKPEESAKVALNRASKLRMDLSQRGRSLRTRLGPDGTPPPVTSTDEQDPPPKPDPTGSTPGGATPPQDREPEVAAGGSEHQLLLLPPGGGEPNLARRWTYILSSATLGGRERDGGDGEDGAPSLPVPPQPPSAPSVPPPPPPLAPPPPLLPDDTTPDEVYFERLNVHLGADGAAEMLNEYHDELKKTVSDMRHMRLNYDKLTNLNKCNMNMLRREMTNWADFYRKQTEATKTLLTSREQELKETRTKLTKTLAENKELKETNKNLEIAVNNERTKLKRYIQQNIKERVKQMTNGFASYDDITQSKPNASESFLKGNTKDKEGNTKFLPHALKGRQTRDQHPPEGRGEGSRPPAASAPAPPAAKEPGLPVKHAWDGSTRLEERREKQKEPDSKPKSLAMNAQSSTHVNPYSKNYVKVKQGGLAELKVKEPPDKTSGAPKTQVKKPKFVSPAQAHAHAQPVLPPTTSGQVKLPKGVKESPKQTPPKLEVVVRNPDVQSGNKPLTKPIKVPAKIVKNVKAREFEDASRDLDNAGAAATSGGARSRRRREDVPTSLTGSFPGYSRKLDSIQGTAKRLNKST